MTDANGISRDSLEAFVAAERHPYSEPTHRITGLMVQYYTVCERELWFMSRGIDIDRDSANIRRGTRVDETSYRDNRKSFQINGRIAIDVLDSGDIMEVKVSSKMGESARLQLLYYLWYLYRILDIEREGVLAYPRERTRERVSLTPENREHIEDVLRGVIEVLEQKTPPAIEKKPVCEACLYQDFCWM
ncbi:CRISPR-associated protein Cas4 [Natronocalculus amylovorans]|uniref:CRISPR-associated exonuclease Cas4 n=1 Tax=Natronocalculus amylovorans TaxID=2917812 RepID=A0AAE3G094_9EURY|nr:CRISPR-associated protein Cas4 [Natronocalculus amylovorans]MCL9818361.1 CRISPR-associated protein Cas4 [Natronocalculus amylovorans]